MLDDWIFALVRLDECGVGRRAGPHFWEPGKLVTFLPTGRCLHLPHVGETSTGESSKRIQKRSHGWDAGCYNRNVPLEPTRGQLLFLVKLGQRLTQPRVMGSHYQLDKV